MQIKHIGGFQNLNMEGGRLSGSVGRGRGGVRTGSIQDFSQGGVGQVQSVKLLLPHLECFLLPLLKVKANKN